MKKGKPEKPGKKKPKVPSAADALVRASKRASATLGEEDLKKVSGGHYTVKA